MFRTTLETTQSSAGQQVAVTASDPVESLRRLLLVSSDDIQELPALADLAAGVMALAKGSRRKVILPLAKAPAELTLVRRGSGILVDYYGTESVPEIFVREHRVELDLLLETCADACRAPSLDRNGSTVEQAMQRLASRVERTAVQSDPHAQLAKVHCTGGSLQSPGPEVPLSFGFEAEIVPGVGGGSQAHAFADVHAMLFEGRLWGFAGDSRFELTRGPILLAAQRMVAAVRALCEAWQADRPLNVRLCSGDFRVGITRHRNADVTLALSTCEGRQVTWPALDVPAVALPILRLTSDLVRRLISVDRNQTHNLRVKTLRREVRELRRIVKTRGKQESFENRDPERFRISSPDPLEPVERAPLSSAPKGLRYTERWSAEIDALDAGSVFLCGDRLIVATNKITLALDRDDGSVLWSQPTARATSMMVGRTLLRALPDGQLELCDVSDGNVYARCAMRPRTEGTLSALFAGGEDVPPMAILTEGSRDLVAVDLRTGQPRWRYRARAGGPFRMRRQGRMLVVVSGGGSVDALDCATGEMAWRFSDRGRFCLKPAIVGDTLVAVSGEPGGGRGAVHAMELFTGKPLWQMDLPAAPSADPIEAQGRVVVAYGGSKEARLSCRDPRDGVEHWVVQDPGVDNGGRAIVVDDMLVVNTPRGRVSALELASGEVRYRSGLSNPLTDDVPRQLEPVLRQGALFVPSAQVHVLRPSDGSSLARDQICDLVPDFLRVDERGWFYVAEESGHLRAYAAAPHLSLVR